MKDPARLESERNFYRGLLGLTHSGAVEPLIRDALKLAVEISGAERVYLRLSSEDPDQPARKVAMSHQCSPDELDDIERRISLGILAEAMAEGQVVQTASALLDDRFRDRSSVRANAIEAVVCAPIGAPPVGVLYLQGRPGAGPFDAEVLRLVEDFAQHLGLIANRLFVEEARDRANDPTARWRDQLNASAIIGRSEAVAQLLGNVAAVAPFEDLWVLLLGESGTGKTLVARTIALNGPRAHAPFVELNCAAVPDNLFESELFGALEGAHSTATRPTKGKVGAADGGTLFLDEVAELSPTAQAKLLQFLESGEYYPLGADTPRRADVRVISATNADLEARAAEGTFRRDLMYRLKGLTIRTPALSERREDIPLLLTHLLHRQAERGRRPRMDASVAARRAAMEAPWPGNIRELANCAQAALALAARDGADYVEAHHLFPEAPDAAPTTLQAATLAFKKDLLRRRLAEHEWNVSAVAESLGVARATVYNLMQGFDLIRPL